MKHIHYFLALVAAMALLGAIGPQIAHAQDDILYVGDAGDNTIKSFNAITGVLQGISEGPLISGLAGPRGIVVSEGELLVVNQNVGLTISGEVLRYSAATVPEFLGRLIAASDKDAPFAPDGIVFGSQSDLFVANVIRKVNLGPPGRVNRYDAGDGAFLDVFKVKNNEHHPRGVVFGRDGLLYVSMRDLKNGLGGTVLRFSPDGKAEVFIDDKGGFGQLNRPDGLVFGPDGQLYVTSFRAAPGDTDSIRIYNANGEFVGKIDLHDGSSESDRVFAQSLLFGPDDKLFVPIANTGEVRRYNTPTTGDFDAFVEQGTTLIAPWYMTFGKTDPGTLEYIP